MKPRTPTHKRKAAPKKKTTPKTKPTPIMAKRKRDNVTLTLSDEARGMGTILAKARGLPFSRFIEELIRRELRAVGILKPEGQ